MSLWRWTPRSGRLTRMTYTIAIAAEWRPWFGIFVHLTWGSIGCLRERSWSCLQSQSRIRPALVVQGRWLWSPERSVCQKKVENRRRYPHPLLKKIALKQREGGPQTLGLKGEINNEFKFRTSPVAASARWSPELGDTGQRTSSSKVPKALRVHKASITSGDSVTY